MMLRKAFSPWALAVGLAFLIGLYLGSLSRWRSSSAAITNAGAHGDADRTAGFHTRARSAKSRRTRRRIEVEEEEEDGDAEAEADADEAPVKHQTRAATKARVGLMTGADVPPKPEGTPLTVKYYDGNAVTVYPHIDHGAGGMNWWTVVPGGWEKDTLQAMHFFLEQKKKSGKRAIQIDFGCWVAPTALFAAKYADKVYAIEPDPAAYREAHHNIELNPALSAKIDKRRMCISDKPGQLTLYGAPGDSMSSTFKGNEASQGRKGYTSWTVDCTTLDVFIEGEGIDTDEIALIKVDTEGHESPIMWQLRDWFKAHPNVVINLSVHAFLYQEDTPANKQLKQRLQEVILDFKTVLFTNGEVVDKKAFDVGGWCYLCSLILTNQDVPAGFDSWKDALSQA